MRILFLDFDGVVNTPMWDSKTHHCRFNQPTDGKVNNVQAVQWVSSFCAKYDYKIVITSSWRIDAIDCRECLKNAGLWDDVEILDATPYLPYSTRGDEINYWLAQLDEPVNYLILDDDDDFTPEQHAHLIQTDSQIGVTIHTYNQLTNLHYKIYKKEND